MAGKAINQYNAFTGLASAVNILVQEINQSDPNTFEHKKANLADMIKSVASVDDVVVGYYYNGTFYEESAHTTALPAVTGRIYIDLGSTPVELYHYTGTAYATVTDNALRSALTGGTVTVDKATKDASGNTITTTYATKAEASEITDELQDTERVVESNSNRIANLEDKSAPFTIDYPDTDYGDGKVPANIEANANTIRIEGETGITNQLMNKANYPASQTYDNGNLVYTNNGDGTITLRTTNALSTNVTIALDSITPPRGAVSGNTYLIMGGSSSIKFGTGNGQASVSTGQGKIAVVTFSSSISMGISIDAGTSIPTEITMPLILRNLTTIFPKLTSAQITALGVAGVLALRPDLGKWNDYDDGSTITPMVTGMEHTGVNKWDEEWELGQINPTTGQNTTGTTVRSKNYIDVLPLKTYYCKAGSLQSAEVAMFFYDANKNFLYLVGAGNTTFTTPANAYFVRFFCAIAYGTTYNHDIQIADNSLPDSVKKTHHAYKHSEIEFSEPISLGSAGSIREHIELETGRKSNPIIDIDLTDIAWVYDANYPNFYAQQDSRFKVHGGITCGVYKPVAGEYADMPDMTISITSAGGTRIRFKDSSHNGSNLVPANNGKAPWLSGKHITVELASPAPDTQISPSPTALEVEPYGEIKVKQSQSIPLSLPFSMTYIPDSPYLMKKDVVDSLSSSATDLPLSANQGRIIKQTLDQHDGRIQNLEEKAGDYVEVNYRGTDAVPTGKCKKALVNTIVHKTRPWNQLAKYVSGARLSQDSEGVFSFVNGSGNIWASNFSMGFVDSNGTLVNSSHSYLVSYVYVSGTIGSEKAFFGNGNNGELSFLLDSSSHAVIITGSNWFPYIRSVSTTDYTDLKFRLVIRDLTLILDDWNASDITTANIPLMVQQIPDLLKWDAFSEAKTISTVVDGVTCNSKNLVDLADVTAVGDSTNNSVYSSYYFPTKYKYNKQYTLSAYVSSSNITFSSAGNLIFVEVFYTDGTVAYGSLVTSSNYSQTRVEMVTTTNKTLKGLAISKHQRWTGGTLVLTDFQLEEGPSATSYSEYGVKGTVTISPASAGHSAGSVADTDELCVEVEEGVYKRRKTTRTMEVDLSAQIWTIVTGTLYSATVQGVKAPATSETVGNITCDKYVPSYSSYLSTRVGMIAVGENEIRVNTGDANTPTGTAVVELATYSETLSDPIINNLVRTEGGGTIETKQTQGTIIDNSLDVGYLALGA